MSGDRGLKNRLSWRITNGSDTCGKILHQHTLSWWDREAQEFSQPLVSYPPQWEAADRTPPPPGGGLPGQAEPGASQLSLSGPLLLSAPSLTRTSGPPPPPPRLGLRPLKSQHSPATWAPPAGQLWARRRVAALRACPEELRGVCWSRSLGVPPARV